MIDIPLFIARFIFSKSGITLYPIVLYFLRLCSNDFGLEFILSKHELNLNNTFVRPEIAPIFCNNMDSFGNSNSTLNNDVLLGYLSYCHTFELTETSLIHNNPCTNIIYNSIKYSSLPSILDLVLPTYFYEQCSNITCFNRTDTFLNHLSLISTKRYSFTFSDVNTDIENIRKSLNFTSISSKIFHFGPKSIDRTTEILRWIFGLGISSFILLLNISCSDNGWIRFLKLIGIYEKVRIAEANLHNTNIDIANHPIIQEEGGVLDSIWLNAVSTIFFQCFNFVLFITLEFFILPCFVGFTFAWSLSDVIFGKLTTFNFLIIYLIGLLCGLLLNYILTLLKRILKSNCSIFFIHSSYTLAYYFSASITTQLIQLFLRFSLQCMIPLLCISVPNKILWEYNNRSIFLRINLYFFYLKFI